MARFRRRLPTDKRKTMKTRVAFTLIELLVVIAVISIIAAILFPVFAKAREKGRQTACLSNQRQLGMAFLAYAQDNDERLPGATDGTAGEGKPGGWIFYKVFGTPAAAPVFDIARGDLFPYVKNKAVYTCPSDGPGQTAGDSYSLNSCLVAYAAPGVNPGKPLSAFSAPSVTMLLGEEAMTDRDPPYFSTDDGFQNLRSNVFSTRHFGGIDIVFLDGHAKFYKTERIGADGLQTGGPSLSGGCQ